ncbi:tetratricopeptide repeat protein [Emcibacter sp.]|uniref:tetratricopeptide repeat protein n=1 Tax=Emcibacter sp. TaxID=1979954 RepID=UPI003A916068
MQMTEEPDSTRYGVCLQMVENDPEQALVFARDWNIARQGLSAARHCEALALMALDRSTEAAELLEREADSILTGNGLGDYALANRRRLRTDLYTQAAIAWQRAGDLDKAYSTLSSALLAAGTDQSLLREIYLERGKIQSLRREYQAAVDDLTRAIEIAPEDTQGYFLRAKVFRYRNNHAAARLDIDRGLELDKDNADFLLESGILYRVTGEKLKAGQVWQKVIDLYPDSEVAETAQQNLDLLKAD